MNKVFHKVQNHQLLKKNLFKIMNIFNRKTMN